MGLEADSQCHLEIFVIFRKKIANLAPFGTNFTSFFEPFKRVRLPKFKSYLKGLNLLSPFPHLLTGQVQTQVKSKTRLNACILELIWPAPPDFATVFSPKRLYYFITASLSLHITQLTIFLLVSTKILFFSFFIKHSTTSMYFSFSVVIQRVQYYNTT